ncbi:hypothetical protein EVAR_6398_1 [Eumeta japonica]|uniref:Uncharacterized protein n=1 Tax=Eumeta variegata TaxID=151549 RepID=A0A4C1TDL2_EUMVA|nr:hypothetical protein EVAR_6398_1 [Eumeta japonica]
MIRSLYLWFEGSAHDHSVKLRLVPRQRCWLVNEQTSMHDTKEIGFIALATPSDLKKEFKALMRTDRGRCLTGSIAGENAAKSDRDTRVKGSVTPENK